MPPSTCSPESAGGSSPRTLGDLLCFSIYSANHAFNRAYKPLLEGLGLTYPQFLVMMVLWEEDDQTVGGLGQRLGLESNTLTPLVKRLEAMELVARRRDAADERQVRVKLTDKGADMRKAGQAIPECLGGAAGLDLAEIRDLKRRLGDLQQALEKTTASLTA